MFDIGMSVLIASWELQRKANVLSGSRFVHQTVAKNLRFHASKLRVSLHRYDGHEHDGGRVMALSDITASAVNSAIQEFDRLDRDAFLQKYGFRKARNYYLRIGGRAYDLMAIAGAAHGLPGQTALTADQFSGGEATVKKVLEGLGFVVSSNDVELTPSPGDVLTNDELGRCFAVGNMGGMRRSKRRDLLLLISDPFKGLYRDRWEGAVLHYTGMGPNGPQSLTYAQNLYARGISEHWHSGPSGRSAGADEIYLRGSSRTLGRSLSGKSGGR